MNTTSRSTPLPARALGCSIAVLVSLLLSAPVALALPDGRAYEQVTPTDKADTDLQFADPTVAAVDGGRIYFSGARGTFGDPTGNSLQNNFRAERTSSGWVTRQLDPPFDPQAGPTNVPFYAFTADLAKGLFSSTDAGVANEPVGNRDIYLRDAESGAISLVTQQAPLVADDTEQPPIVGWTSADLAHVLFVPTGGTAYFPGDPDDDSLSIFYYADAATGQVSRPELIPDESTPDPDDEILGTPASPGAGVSTGWTEGAISDDGHSIFFSVGPSAGQVSSPQSGAQLYVRRDHGAPDAHTVRVSAPEAGVTDQSPGVTFAAWFRAASRDGSRVLFTSCEALTADATVDASGANAFFGACGIDSPQFGTSKSDLYLFDVATGDVVDLTTADAGGADVIGFVGASEDGSRAYFVARGDLAQGATQGEPNLYLWQDGQGVRHIATLDPTPDPAPTPGDPGGDRRVWEPPLGQRFKEARVTADGGHLAFSSRAPLDPQFDSAGHSQVYLYDAETDELVCASCVGAGPATADATMRNQVRPLDAPKTPRILQSNLVQDGRVVFFESAARLADEDFNDTVDVYRFDAATADVALVSPGSTDQPSYFANASENGLDAFFETRQRVVGWDTDNLVDIYDARVGGGFPEPTPAAPDCGFDCQGAPAGRPILVDPASGAPTPGDLTPGPRPAFSVRRLSRVQRSALAHGRRVELVVHVNRPGRVVASATATLGGRRRTVAHGVTTAHRAGNVHLGLELSRAALRRLANHGRMRISLAVRFAGVREARKRAFSLTSERRARVQSTRGRGDRR